MTINYSKIKTLKHAQGCFRKNAYSSYFVTSDSENCRKKTMQGKLRAMLSHIMLDGLILYMIISSFIFLENKSIVYNCQI